MSGYIQCSILWHLLHTGAATSATLARVIGCPRASVNRAVRGMRADSLVTKRPDIPRVLELTVKGIDAARAVDVTETEQSAEEPAALVQQVQPTEPAAAHQLAYVTAGVVQPARFNLMTAAAYLPDPGPALRPGAFDYKRVASVGQRC